MSQESYQDRFYSHYGFDMRNRIKIDPIKCSSEEYRREVARGLFKKLDMLRAADSDYEYATALLHDFFRAGYTAGYDSGSQGPRC